MFQLKTQMGKVPENVGGDSKLKNEMGKIINYYC